MNKLLNVIKVSVDTLMTIIIIIGILFIVLFFMGIKPFVVQTGSMEPAIETGSVSFIDQNVKFEDVKVNDVIAFRISGGGQVTHRAISISEEGIQTKGDANPIADGVLITKETYLGKNVFTIPKVGYAIAKVQTKRGKIMLGTVMVMLFLSSIFMGEPQKEKKSKEAKEAKVHPEELNTKEVGHSKIKEVKHSETKEVEHRAVEEVKFDEIKEEKHGKTEHIRHEEPKKVTRSEARPRVYKPKRAKAKRAVHKRGRLKKGKHF